jgi:DNA-binding Xre family transcriptional regulator
MNFNVPLRYLPKSLSLKDKKEQAKMLAKSRKLYKQKKYYTRKPVKSFHSKTSNHILNARKTYKINSILPSKELSKATGCSIATLQKIVNKGEGAYFSSGSRPNQTAQSWGIARLASAITAGKAAAVDYNILEEGCHHKKKAFKLAKKARKIYHYGHSKTPKVNANV